MGCDQLKSDSEPPPFLTVFMNDDGTVARTYRHLIVPDENNSYVLPNVSGTEHFEAMGIPPEELGRRGRTMDTADDAAIIRRYFPDALLRVHCIWLAPGSPQPTGPVS